MGAFARWRALSRDERRLTMQSFVAVSVAVGALHGLGLDRSLRLASRSVGGRTKTVIADVVTAVDRAGRYVPGGTCLPKSLALSWMLRGRGVAAVVRIGVRTAGPFEAHAWVECDGVPVTDPSDPKDRFVTILSS